MYGKELILDIHGCDPTTFTRESIEEFFVRLCKLIDMTRADLHFWDYDDPEEFEAAPPHLKGISAIQFIMTSNIVIHALHDLKAVYLNIFSCKDFDGPKTRVFARNWFGGKIKKTEAITRE